MKATIKITIMLIAMIAGTLGASGQSAQRGTPHKEQQRKTSPAVSSSSSSKTSKISNGNSEKSTNRQVTSRTNNSRSNSQQLNSKTATEKQQANRSTSQSNQRIQPTQRTETVNQNPRSVSTTTQNNSRSTYRTPDRTVHTGNTRLDPKSTGNQMNKTSHVVVDRSFNSSGHSHAGYYYPSKRVKIHVHPTTYHNHYRVIYYPAHREIIWTRSMHRYYVDLYPGYIWRYHFGYHIQTISAFDAKFNVGEVARVYGRVYGTWYNKDSDDLLLFFGGEFPYQEFTMVVPGNVARRFSWRPERYFLGQHVFATGLITSFEGKPELVIKKKQQLDVY